jgi:RNA polymerase sigma-70 factor (ECF subfamily)
MIAVDTLTLLARARAGDEAALDALVARYRPALVRWARGRLPVWARDLADTDDLVQNALIKTIRNLDSFQPACEASFQQYLRQAVRNVLRDEIRGARRRPAVGELDPDHASDAPTPLERLLGRERLARYEDALARLTETERGAIVARLEFGFTHRELAAALGKGTPDAARKLTQKAMSRLLELMHDAAPAD